MDGGHYGRRFHNHLDRYQYGTMVGDWFRRWCLWIDGSGGGGNVGGGVDGGGSHGLIAMKWNTRAEKVRYVVNGLSDSMWYCRDWGGTIGTPHRLCLNHIPHSFIGDCGALSYSFC